MLSSVSLRVKANRVGVVIITAQVYGIEVEPQGSGVDGWHYIDLEGKTDKIDLIVERSGSEVLSRVESVPGEHEGYGLVTDIANGSRVNYGSLMTSHI